MQNTREFFERSGLDFGSDDVRTKGLAFTPTVNRENRTVQGLVSTSGMDLDGEVIVQNFDMSYFPGQVKAVYLDHMYTRENGVAAVGVCRNLTQRKEGLFATTHVLKSQMGDDILDAMEAGALSGFSIGFQVTEAGPATNEEMELHKVAEGTTVIRASKLLEYSFTSMPANGEALAKMMRDGRLPEMKRLMDPPKGRSLVVVNDVVLEMESA